MQNISSRPVRIALSLRVLLDSTIVNYKLGDFFSQNDFELHLSQSWRDVLSKAICKKIRLVWICPPLPFAMSHKPPGVGQTGGRQSIGKRLFGALVGTNDCGKLGGGFKHPMDKVHGDHRPQKVGWYRVYINQYMVTVPSTFTLLYFLFSSRTLEKISNLTFAYFWDGLVKNHQPGKLFFVKWGIWTESGALFGPCRLFQKSCHVFSTLFNLLGCLRSGWVALWVT